MRKGLNLISLLMLAVLLATVLAPTYGWEATADEPMHSEPATEFDGAHRSDSGGDDSGHGDKASHERHGCAGHLHGHLIVVLMEGGVLALLEALNTPIPERVASARSVIPRRLERPPRAPVPA